MSTSNVDKKKKIDKIVDDYQVKLGVLKKKKKLVVNNFLDILKNKKIEDIKNKINKL